MSELNKPLPSTTFRQAGLPLIENQALPGPEVKGVQIFFPFSPPFHLWYI